jgi:chemotaxis signal transduction protein
VNEHLALTFVSLSRSQAQVFEQLSDEDFWHYATEAASPPRSLPRLADEYLVCRLGIRYCMLPLTSLVEVVPSPHQLTLLPSVPHWMLGLTTWKSEVIAEIDLEAYLWSGVEFTNKITAAAYIQRPAANLLLVVHTQGVTIGLAVTAANTTVRFDAEYIVPFELAPDWCLALRPEGIRGVIDDVLVLNVPAIFDDVVQQIKEQSLS